MNLVKIIKYSIYLKIYFFESFKIIFLGRNWILDQNICNFDVKILYVCLQNALEFVARFEQNLFLSGKRRHFRSLSKLAIALTVTK